MLLSFSMFKPMIANAAQTTITWSGATSNASSNGDLNLTAYVQTQDANYHYFYQSISGGGTVTVQVDATRINITGGLDHNKQPDFIAFRDNAVYITLNRASAANVWSQDNVGWLRPGESHHYTITYTANKTAQAHYGGTATCTQYPACASCGRRYGSALGHAWNWITDSNATCTTNGLRHQHCSRCDANQSLNTVWQYALGHSYNEGEIEKFPTVYDVGTRIKKCIRCNNSIKEDEPKYHFSIFVGLNRIQKIAKGSNVLFGNTTQDAARIPFVTK